jgi:hypothetical protein
LARVDKNWRVSWRGRGNKSLNSLAPSKGGAFLYGMPVPAVPSQLSSEVDPVSFTSSA